MGLFDFAKVTAGVDPGSQNLRIIKDGELVFNEESQITVNIQKNVFTGVGKSIGNTTNDLIIKPVNYVIGDFQGFEMLLRGALNKASKAKRLLPPTYIMYYSIPTTATEVERRAYRDSAEHAGAAEVYTVTQDYCSAIGMNILLDKSNFILIDFSASKIEIVIFADTLVIANGAIRYGTWKIFSLLKNHIRRKYRIDLNDKEVENLLIALDENRSADEVKVHYTSIKVSEIQDVLDNFFNLVNDQILETIESVTSHPDIAKVIANGVYFTGGGSMFKFLRDQIKLDERIRRTLSQNPLLDTVNGLKQIIAEKEKFKKYITT